MFISVGLAVMSQWWAWHGLGAVGKQRFYGHRWDSREPNGRIQSIVDDCPLSCNGKCCDFDGKRIEFRS